MTKRLAELRMGCGKPINWNFNNPKWICGDFIEDDLTKLSKSYFCDLCQARISEREMCLKEFLNVLKKLKISKYSNIGMEMHIGGVIKSIEQELNNQQSISETPNKKQNADKKKVGE